MVVLKDGKIERLVEKPKDPPSDLALVGVYFFDNTVFEAVKNIQPSKRNELEITDALQWLVDKGYTVAPHVIHKWWKDTGKPEDMLEANRIVLGNRRQNIGVQGDVDELSSITPSVEVEPVRNSNLYCERSCHHWTVRLWKTLIRSFTSIEPMWSECGDWYSDCL